MSLCPLPLLPLTCELLELLLGGLERVGVSLEELPRVVEGPAAHDVVGAEGQRVDAVPVARQRPHQLPEVTPRPVQRPHLHAPQGAGLKPANRVCSLKHKETLNPSDKNCC